MKPTWVRDVPGGNGNRVISSMSKPGALNPLHETLTRCVTASGGTPAWCRAALAARQASPAASAS